MTSWKNVLVIALLLFNANVVFSQNSTRGDDRSMPIEVNIDVEGDGNTTSVFINRCIHSNDAEEFADNGLASMDNVMSTDIRDQSHFGANAPSHSRAISTESANDYQVFKKYINGEAKYGYQKGDTTVVIPARYQFAYPFYNGVARVVEGEKMKFINKYDCTLVLKQYFDFATDFHRNRAIVRNGGQWYMISDCGSLVSMFPTLKEVIGYSENRFVLKAEKGSYMVGLDGKAIGEDSIFTQLDVPKFGLAAATKHDTVGYVDREGRWRLTEIDKKRIVSATRFTRYKTAKVVLDDKTTHIIDTLGNILTQRGYSFIDSIDKGITVYREPSGQYGLISPKGHPITEAYSVLKPLRIKDDFFQFSSRINWRGNENEVVGVWNGAGKVVVPAKFDRVMLGEQGSILANVGDFEVEYGTNGNCLSNCYFPAFLDTFRQAGPIVNRYFAVENREGLYGICDTSYNRVVEATYQTYQVIEDPEKHKVFLLQNTTKTDPPICFFTNSGNQFTFLADSKSPGDLAVQAGYYYTTSRVTYSVDGLGKTTEIVPDTGLSARRFVPFRGEPRYLVGKKGGMNQVFDLPSGKFLRECPGDSVELVLDQVGALKGLTYQTQWSYVFQGVYEDTKTFEYPVKIEYVDLGEVYQVKAYKPKGKYVMFRLLDLDLRDAGSEQFERYTIIGREPRSMVRPDGTWGLGYDIVLDYPANSKPVPIVVEPYAADYISKKEHR